MRPAAGSLVVTGERVSLAPGEALFRQGDPGDACYLLRVGRVELCRHDEGAVSRVLSTLHAGVLLGERALLAGGSHDVTARALDSVEVVRIARTDFLALMASSRAGATAILQQWRLQARPRQCDGVTITHQADLSAEPSVILKHPGSGAYYRLSPAGWFVWQRLDGEHTVSDLTVAYWEAHRQLAPVLIAEVVAGLTNANFVEAPALAPDVAALLDQRTTADRITLAAQRLLDLSLPLTHPDAVVERIYRRGGFLLCRPAGIAVLFLLAIGGAISWLLAGPRAAEAGALSPLMLLFLLPLRLVTVVLHELAHALAARAAGCRVRAAGIGLYWLTPVAWVDTSETWLASRRARIGVSLAGILADLALGGLAGILATFVDDPLTRAVLFQATLLSYGSAVANLCPALKFDGYYVLSDLLDRPNLRQRALALVAHQLPTALRSPRTLWAHRVDLAYVMGSLVYLLALVPVTAWTVALFVRLWAPEATGGHAPTITSILAWGVAALTAVVTGLGVLGELRAARATQVRV